MPSYLPDDGARDERFDEAYFEAQATLPDRPLRRRLRG
jgi:hypothetical protein